LSPGATEQTQPEVIADTTRLPSRDDTTVSSDTNQVRSGRPSRRRCSRALARAIRYKSNRQRREPGPTGEKTGLRPRGRRFSFRVAGGPLP
jgi:hypothetical protein